MKYKVFTPGKILARIASVVMWNRFRYPQPVRGRYDVADNWMEKLKWAYRCWCRQIEVAERGSGLETYFAEQSLHFTLPPGFKTRTTMTVSAGGDLMAVDCLTAENTPRLFDEIADFYFGADLTCANLESTVYGGAPLGRNQVTGQPAKMNTSEAMLDRFVAGGSGIDYVSTANNHCLDYGEEGLRATLDILDRKNVAHSGTNRDPVGQDDVLVMEINGIRIAMLAYTFDMNGNECEEGFLVNEVRFNDEICDLSLVRRHIGRAREKGADLIVASCHWGWEFEMYPHSNIVEVGHRLIEEGVDVIIGGHPHVSQPMERYPALGGDGRVGLILYSLGDFVSHHPVTKNSKLTTVVRFSVSKGEVEGEEQTRIHDLRVLPVYILAEEKGDASYNCQLVKFSNVLADREVGGAFTYGLTNGERADLGRLDSKILRGILLPRDHGGILVPN